MIAKTSTKRSAELRDRMRKAGFVLRHVWVHPADWPRVRKFLNQFRRIK